MSLPIDRLVRSRRKTVALIVRPDGTLEVRAPLRLAELRIREFVESHADWVCKQQARARKAAPPPAKKFTERENFIYLGQSFPLTIVPRQRQVLTFDGQIFRLAKSALPKARELFVRWYQAQAGMFLMERVLFHARKHGLHYEKIRISSARTRWGSCSSKGTLSFTWRLVMAPPEIVDYVVIHELVHTKIPNHSQAFWQGVAGIIPDYKQRLTWLRKNGKYLSLD
jgi:predicted metal-dependent hydrolase